jgi:hypothetical protein
MSKQTLEWHEQCLKNATRYAAELHAKAYADFNRDMEAYSRAREGCLKLERHFIEAKRNGFSGFDAERFMKARGVEVTKQEERG